MNPAKIIGVIALITVCAACSSSGSGGSSPTSSAPVSTGPTSSVAPDTSTPPPSTSAAPSSSTASSGSGLLTVADLGTGYTQDPPDNSPESRLPCTPKAPPLFTQVPPKSRTVVNFTNETAKVGVSEDVVVFADAATALRAITVSVRGFACKTGSLDGTSATIAGPKSVTIAGTDSAQVWDLGSTQFVATAILMRTGTVLVGLVFAAPSGGGKSVPIQQITETAATRAAALR